MATQDQTNAINGVLAQINSAETALNAFVDTASTEQARALKPISDQLTNLSTSLAKSLTIADDAVFRAAAAALKNQVADLQKEEAAMQKVLNQVDKAGKVAGYIAQALSAISKL